MEWISVEDKLPNKDWKYTVQLENGSVQKAFFYLDKIAWIAFYGQKTSHWWDAKPPYERLDNVTHWKK